MGIALLTFPLISAGAASILVRYQYLVTGVWPIIRVRGGVKEIRWLLLSWLSSATSTQERSRIADDLVIINTVSSSLKGFVIDEWGTWTYRKPHGNKEP